MHAFIAALACAFPFAAQAQEAPKIVSLVAVPDPVDPATLAEAHKLVSAIRVEDTINRMFSALAPTFAQSVFGALTSDAAGQAILAAINAKPGASDRFRTLLASEYLGEIKKRIPELLNELAVKYATLFTLDELRAINAFYATGAGRKLVDLQARLQQDMAALGAKVGADAGRIAGEKAFEKLSTEYGLEEAEPRA
jgi:hypothetical protein